MADAVLVGVDFTAEELRLLFTDLDGDVVEQGVWQLPPLPNEDAWSWEIGGRIASLFAANGEQRSALAIAVAAPGVVDPLTGRLTQSFGQPTWEGLAITDTLRRHFDAPIACESHIQMALQGERWQGAALGLDNVLYVSLRGIPAAAVVAEGRPIRGARFSAGALPAMPALDPQQPITDDDLETASGLLADAVALLDPKVIVVDGNEQHLGRLIPLLQRVLNEVAPGPQVLAAALGEGAAVIGAIRMATTLAYEGERKP